VKSGVIYTKKIILMPRKTRPSKEYILTKNRKDKSKTNKTRAKNKTNR
jgi:hypothetical protein